MLQPGMDLQEFVIVASDGATDVAIRDVKHLYFDDEAWAIRCLHDGRAAYWPGSEAASDRAALPPAA